MKDALCWSSTTGVVADANCQAMDFGIAQSVLQMPLVGGGADFACVATMSCDPATFGADLPLGATTAPLLAFFAQAVSMSQTAASATPLTQIYPTLASIYECEARAMGLVWANIAGPWTMTQSCIETPGCKTALDNIRKVSSSKDEMLPIMNKKAEATWDYVDLLDMYIPMQAGNALCNGPGTAGYFCSGHGGNDNDALCNIVFAALDEENLLALTWIATAASLMFNGPDDIIAHCNESMAKGMAMLLGLTISGAAVGGILITSIACCLCRGRSRKEDAI
jgi:hypothetical protein